MTMAATYQPLTYNENGSTLAFAVSWQFEGSAELVVTEIDTAGVRTVLTLGSGYSVTGGGGSTGTVTKTVARPVGWKLEIARRTSRAQGADYEHGGDFPAESHEDALDRLAKVDQEQDVDIADIEARSLRFKAGQTADEIDKTELVGKFLVGDAEGNLIPSAGTGADAGLREDLAEETGAQLVGTALGKSVASIIKGGAPQIMRGLRMFTIDRFRAFAFADAFSNPANNHVWGFARVGGTTGGFGLPTKLLITNESDDPNDEGSLPWVLQEIKDAGGGTAVWHTRGPIRPTLNTVQYLPDNLTLVAPGLNVEILTSLANGAFRFYGPSGAAGYGNNIIVYGVPTLVEGGSEVTAYDVKPGEVDAFAIVPEWSNKIFVSRSTISGATDGAFDMAGGAEPAGDRYYTLDRMGFRNCDKTMAIGDGGGAGAVGDTRKIWVSIGLSHFDGCAQRKPMVSKRAFVHFVYCVDDSLPHFRDATDGTTISAYGCGDVREGGQLLYESNLVGFGTTAAGLAGAVHQGIADADGTGAAKLLSNVFAPGIINTSDIRAASVVALPPTYTYPPASTVPSFADPVTARRAIIEGAGAGRTNFPRGNFVQLTAAEADAMFLPGIAYPLSSFANGQQIVYDEGIFSVRIDEESPLEEPSVVDALALSRGSTLLVDAAGTVSLLDDRVVAIEGAGGAADDLTTINLTTDPNYARIAGGFLWIRNAGNSMPITLQPLASKSISAVDATANTLTITAHGIPANHGAVRLSNAGGALPGGLAIDTDYWVIVVDANTVKLATSAANAIAGTAIDLTSVGTGAHTLIYGNINLFQAITLNDTRKWAMLFWNGDSWDVMFGPRLMKATGWTADTGTAKRSANATYTPGTALTFGAAYSEAELDAAATRIAAIEAALRDQSQALKAVKDDLISTGRFGA
jgi:hypothetical protein